VFPAVALAAALKEQGDVPILATDARAANYDYPDWLEVKVLSVTSPSGGLSNKLSAIWNLLKSIFEAAALVQKFKPAAIVGFGGYPSFPSLAIAMARGIPLILHEQNRYLGKANRMAAGAARKIALSFPDTKGIRPADQAKCQLVGNPARPEILALRDAPYPVPKEGEPLELLIFAGSQGARVFSEVVPDAIRRLPEALRQRLRVTQQCREEDIETVKVLYEEECITAELRPFFDDMPKRLSKAHLVLCRSGASTVTELMAIGRPAIYVPLAIATDDHQTLNAQYLEAENAGWLLPSSQFEPEALAARLEYCLSRPEVLEKTAEAAKDLAKVDAARSLTELISNHF
jgi:UDP-N-acetylglucosamine--N-acetylmuramyl-(pentapeptide) pyrophosphoryl-undecaprenol N-acetylglucosamine transferase